MTTPTIITVCPACKATLDDALRRAAEAETTAREAYAQAAAYEKRLREVENETDDLRTGRWSVRRALREAKQAVADLERAAQASPEEVVRE